MGTWDLGPFDNDTAADWSGEFGDASEAARLEMLEEALRGAADSADYLDVDFACQAIAAAAVIAAQLPGGPPLLSYGPEVSLEGTLDLPPQLPALALRALDRITDEDSEWRDLWDEADRLDEAVAVLEPIRAALAQT